jgi:predicted NBD/HSP70 family sugar kinase
MPEIAVDGGDLPRLRRLNALSALRVLRGAPSLTLTQLAQRIRLSRPAAEDVVQELVVQGWVIEVPPVTGAMGRPARRYRFRPEAGHVVGIDVGAHKVLAIVADLDGSVVASRRVAVTPETRRSARLAAIDEATAAGLASAGLRPADVWGVGAASTGMVDRAGRVTLSVVPEWTGADLAGHLGRTFACPVVAENDCRLAALAERWRGVAHDADNVVYVLAGTRTGAGLIIDGRLLRGAHGAAGEIGVLPSAGWGSAQDHLRNWSGLPGGLAEVEVAGHVFAAARSGDPGAVEAVGAYVRDLGIGTAALVLAVDPQLVVLGGGFSRSSDVLLEPLRRELEKLCLHTPELRTSALGDEGPALGAVRHVLDLVERQVFGAASGPAAPVAPIREVTPKGTDVLSQGRGREGALADEMTK